MALRLRRGTDAERLLITPVEGELIYTTDTKLLYVGDGSTAGGTLVTGAGGGGSATLDGLTDTDVAGALDNQVLTWIAGNNKWEPTTIPGVGALSISDLSDVDLNGALVNAILRYDGVNWVTTSAESLVATIEGNLKINVVGNDSTIMVDGDNNTLTGDLTGNVLGNVTGNIFGNINGNVNADDGTNVLYNGTDGTDASFTGEVIGNITSTGISSFSGTVNFTGATINNLSVDLVSDLKGSVFGDDSSLLVDSVSGLIRGDVQSNSVQAGNIKLTTISSDNVLYLRTNAESNFFTISTEDTAGTVLITSNTQIGAPGDSVERTLRLFNSNTSAATLAISQIHNSDTGPGGSIGLLRSRGTKTVPTVVQIGDVLGSYATAGFNGALYRGAGGIRTVVAGTPESLRVPANVEIVTTNSSGNSEVKLTIKDSGETVFAGAAQLASYADASARDTAIPSPVAGMMVFITGTSKFQGNVDSTITGWVDIN